MKTFKIISLTLLVSLTAFSVKAGGHNSKEYPDNLHKHIEKKIDYPRAAR
jgi:hypothetical protein